MRNHRWLLYLLTILGFVALSLHAEKVAQLPKPTGYVDDYAKVLSPNAKTDMEAICVELHNKTKAQIFVVTVNTLDGETIEPYANDLFHTWKIGEKKTDRGVLLLFAIKDHKYRIEVGYGLEGILNDAKVGDIGRAMVPYLRANNYDSALRTSLNSVAKIIADDSNVALDTLSPPAETAPPPAPAPSPVDSNNNHSWVFIVLFAIVFFGIFGLVIVLRIFGGKRGSTSSGGSGFFTTGGSDSGSSSDSGSGGFGGGDGGDSGGGGASGSW